QKPNTAPDVLVSTQVVEVIRGPYADLVVQGVTAPPTATNNQEITVSWTVRNQGIALTSTEAWTDRVYLTTDPTGATGRTLLGAFGRAGRLDVLESYGRTVEVVLPASTQGRRYLVVETGGPYEAVFTDNNSAISGAIDVTFIPPPQSDLEITRVTAPSEALDGAAIDVSWTVRNNGPDPVFDSWTDVVYLAPNGSLSGATVLGSFRVDPPLDAGRTYTRTVSFTLPSKIQGVYAIVVRTDANGAIDPARAANNQMPSGALTISLRTRPDLQVTQANGPETVTAGAAIDVRWTVSNLGSSPTPVGGSRWLDGVYLSLNNTLDGGDLLLGSLDNGQALAPGQNYISTANYRLPRQFSGNMFLIFAPDYTNVVDEAPNPAPDYVAVPIAIDAIPVPPPDLVLTSVTAPVEAFDGTHIVVRYTVENRGPGPTSIASWTDSLWLTTTKERPNPSTGDIALGYSGHSGVLQPGERYEASLSVRLPSEMRGQFYITAWTDSSDAVFETALATNVNPDAPSDIQGSNFKASTPISILLQPSADLVVTQVLAPTTALGGSQVTLTWTVKNEGAIATQVDRWVDAVYLSTAPTLDERGAVTTRVFAAPNFGTLLPGQSYTQVATFTLPPSAEGSYFIVQTNENPNILSDVEDQLFAEVEAIIRRAERELGRPLSEVNLADVRQLTPGQLRRILTDPNQSAPALVFEGPFTKNNQRGAASTVTNRPPDLVVSNVTVVGSVFSGEKISVTWTVTNAGANPVFAGTKQWSDWVLFSEKAVFDPDAVAPLGSVVHVVNEPMKPGDSYTVTASFEIPAGISGDRYLFVVTDPNIGFYPRFSINLNGTGAGAFPDWPSFFAHRVWEGATKANNVGMDDTLVVYREADLRLTDVVAPAGADSSGTFQVRFTTVNDGTRATRTDGWLDSVYLSRDTAIDASDKLIGTIRHRGLLEAGASYSDVIEARLPDNISGEFHLIVITNAGYGPGLGDDPTRFPGVISTTNRPALNEYRGTAPNHKEVPFTVRFVPGPDLVVSEVSSTERVLVGRPFTATWTVKNNGAGVVPDRQSKWTDSVYLSRDQFLDVRSDLLVGAFDHQGVLAPGATYSKTANLNLPRGVVGAYYVFVLTDPIFGSQARGQLVETAETNNSRATPIPMLIELPPPSDLQVDAVVVPSSGTVGGTINLTATVTNRGVEPAVGKWFDHFHLSADGIWDYGDPLLGTAGPPDQGRSLAPGQSYTVTITVSLPPALPGSYRVIARTDAFNDVHEGPRDDNNLTVSADAVAIAVPTLVVGIPATENLPARGQTLYRVTVAAGQTLQIDLAAAAGLHEVYVRYEALPNSIEYDAAFEGALAAAQSVLVPTTKAGTYYILARSQGPAAAITLSARYLPFAITSITPDTAGAGRYVTMTVRGAQFSPQATLKLIRPQFGEYVPVSYAVADATRIVAVFDLRDAPLGLYDLQVTNPDGAAIRLPYRFLIEPARPLDVTVGLGGPDVLLLS
ncbi:MAG: hypothetical protein IT580_15635, partial [Verrucomicrobiales bacterium]|nr:hypothetical protein [Verrucomicrobiales bacterium]